MRNINELIGIIKGINFDGIINDKETARLQTWVDKNRNLAYEPRQVELIKLVDSVLEDHVIDDGERDLLLAHSEKILEEAGDGDARIYELNGIIEGVVCDGEVNEEEVRHLKDWMDNYGESIRDHKPSYDLCQAIDEILEDDVVTEDEQQKLLEMLSARIDDSQFETKLAFLCRQVKARKNIGIDLIDMLDNQNVMEEIHHRAEKQLALALNSYSGSFIYDSEIIFVSLCLIGMLEYDGSFYDSVRNTYANLYRRYPQQKIEGMIRSILNRYRTEEERSRASGTKNAIISVVLSNAIVPSHYLGAFFEFIYDIYKFNFEYDLPKDIYEEFQFVYDGLKRSMMSDGDEIQDHVTKKTYKLIKSTKQLIAEGKYLESVIKLSIIIVKLIDKKIWNKELKIYNPYIKVGFDRWSATLKDDVTRDRQKKASELRSRWEPKFLLEGNDVYLVPPIHKVKAQYNYWDIYIQVLCGGSVVFEDRDPDIREIIAGYKICANKIYIDKPLDGISYRLMCGSEVIYDSKEKLFRKFIVFDKDGLEIHNNTDYKGTAVFCYKNEQDKLVQYYSNPSYKLASRSIKYGDSYFIDDVVFNFSAMMRPGIFGDEYESVYLLREAEADKVKVFKEVKFLVFESENISKTYEISINGKKYSISKFSCITSDREGVCKYVVDLAIFDVGIYDITVCQIINGKKKQIAKFDFVLDPEYKASCNKLDDQTFVYEIRSSLSEATLSGQIELDYFSDKLFGFEYKGKKYYYLVPFDLEAYRLSESKWKPLSDEIWIGDVSNETVLDIYDSDVEEFMVYSDRGQKLENVAMKDRGTYRRAPIGFLLSYKEEYDYTFLAFLKNGIVKKTVFCNNKCQMRDETEIIFDSVTRRLQINPWFYGKGNVCCEIFDSNDESVFRREALKCNSVVEVQDLMSYETYTIVFSEKNKGLGLVKKKNREMKRFRRVFYAQENFVGREFKIDEIVYEDADKGLQEYRLQRSYIKFQMSRLGGGFIGEIYLKTPHSNLYSNYIKLLEIEVCSEVINGRMELSVTKNETPLSVDMVRNHVAESKTSNEGRVNVYLSTRKGKECKYCGESIASEQVDYYIEPINGFKTGVTKESTRMKPRRSYAGEVSYLGDGQRNDSHFEIGTVIAIDTSTNDELLVMNKSSFYMCPVCGYSDIAKGTINTPSIMKEHKNYRQFNCNTDELEKVKLGHSFQTDVARLTIPLLQAFDKADYARALSFMYAFLEGISIALGIERNDIDGILELNLEQHSYDVLIYDNVPGGAGHVKRLVDKEAIVSVLNAAYEKVSQQCCDENTSCYKCLRNYYNQSHHGKLQRKYAKEYIEQLLREIQAEKVDR